MIERLRNKPAGYALAILIVALATMLRLVIHPWFPEGLIYIIFSPCVMVAAILAGFWPGVFATLLSALCAVFFFIEPRYQFLPLTGPDLMGLSIFIALGFFMSSVARLYHRAIERAVSARDELVLQQRISLALCQSAQALRESEERFTAFMNHLPAAAWMKDLQGRYIYANNEATAIFSTPLAALLGKTDVEIFPPETARLFRENDGHALEEEGALQTVEVLRQADGMEHHSIVSKFALRGQDGRAQYLCGMAFDITERREAELALQRAKDEWESTFNSVPDLIALLDNQHRIVRVNQAMAQRLGKEPGEFVGQDCYRAIHGTEDPPAYCPHGLTIADCLEHTAEMHEERLGGDFLVTTTPIRNADGEMIGTVHVARDITERKRYEEQLRKTAQDLERSNKDLEHFAYVASHDLQEPLRSVSAFAGMLEKRYKDRLDQDANEFIQFIVGGAARMQTLILDLLAYSRVGSRGNPLVSTPAEEALDDALQALKENISDTDALVTRGPLPVVRGDKLQIAQLFQNLIGNAIKFRREGIRPEIHISAKQNGRFWTFRVSDNGIGIDPKYSEKIFTIFERLHTTEKYKGTGIGLAICKRIVERHGGDICLDSEPDKGTSFYFTLQKA